MRMENSGVCLCLPTDTVKLFPCTAWKDVDIGGVVPITLDLGPETEMNGEFHILATYPQEMSSPVCWVDPRASMEALEKR
jgi:hypothetical protein